MVVLALCEFSDYSWMHLLEWCLFAAQHEGFTSIYCCCHHCHHCHHCDTSLLHQVYLACTFLVNCKSVYSTKCRTGIICLHWDTHFITQYLSNHKFDREDIFCSHENINCISEYLGHRSKAICIVMTGTFLSLARMLGLSMSWLVSAIVNLYMTNSSTEIPEVNVQLPMWWATCRHNSMNRCREMAAQATETPRVLA